LKFYEQFLFLDKATPCGKIFNYSVQKVFTVSPTDVVVFKFYKKKFRRNRALFTGQKNKFRLSLKLSLPHGSRPKSVRPSPQHLAHFVPDFIKIG